MANHLPRRVLDKWFELADLDDWGGERRAVVLWHFYQLLLNIAGAHGLRINTPEESDPDWYEPLPFDLFIGRKIKKKKRPRRLMDAKQLQAWAEKRI